MNRETTTHEVVIGVLGDGTYVAASSSSPYFCFVAGTEDAVKKKVEAAVTFYASAYNELQKNPVKSKSRNWTVTKLIPVGTFDRSALAGA